MNLVSTREPAIALHLRELFQHRDLFFAWTERELRVRYKQSLLGGLWAILQPLVLMLLFALVFSVFIKIPTDGIPYPIFAYTALLPWMYFATAITFGTMSLVNNINLVTKIYFPREILPLASTAAALVDFVIASAVLVMLMLYYRIPFYPTLAWLPVLILLQTIFIAGLLFFTTAFIVFYRDTRFVIPLALQAWMYATPIIYPLSVVPARLLPFYMLNPMAGLIDSYRSIILRGSAPDPLALGLASFVAALTLVAGYAYFKHVDQVLPDVI